MGSHSEAAVLENPAPEPTATSRTTGDRLRFVARGLGQTFITFGLIILLFVFYEVYVTNWLSAAEQAKVKHELLQEFANGDDPLLKLPGTAGPDPLLGKGIANLYIPRLGNDYEFTIVEGSSQEAIEKGPGHYPGTAMPGQVGNFALGGHRVGKGEPFLNLDYLRPNDAVIIETESHFYVYRIKGTEHGLTQKDSDGIPGREVVDPDNATVLLPVPDHPGAKASERLLTMTTCTPKFTAQHRMILFGHLDPSLTYTKPTGTSPMPAPIKALFGGLS